MESVKGAAARAIFPLASGMHHTLEFTFEDTDGNSIVISMELGDASKFLQSGLNAFDAAIPKTPRAPIRSPIG